MSEIAATAPIWLPILIEAINDAPAIVRMIDLANLPALSDDQMNQLRAAMNAAVAKLDADIAAMEKSTD